VKAQIQNVGIGMDGKCYAMFTMDKVEAQGLCELQGGDVKLTAEKWHEKRSLSANALMWCVCDELAQALKITKIEVYRKAIRDVGVYEPLPIRDDAVDAFCRNWEQGGDGWVADRTDKSKTPGYTLVFAYFGSSTYDTKQFSRLVDWLIDEAEQIGIVLKAGPELEQKAKEYGL